MSLALIMGLGSKLTQETLATLLAELWVIRDGLSISIDLGINALIVKSDAKVAVDLLNNDSLSNATNASLVALLQASSFLDSTG